MAGLTHSLPLMDGLAERIGKEDVSFRTRMLEIARRGPSVISLARGDPDFHAPSHIAEAAKKAIDDNEHHYTHPAGMPQLRKPSRRSYASTTTYSTRPTRSSWRWALKKR
jgi:aminotransferase